MYGTYAANIIFNCSVCSTVSIVDILMTHFSLQLVPHSELEHTFLVDLRKVIVRKKNKEQIIWCI